MKVKWLAKWKGSQLELARISGVTVGGLSLIVNGHRKPSAGLAARISAGSGGTLTIVELLFPEGLPEGAVLCRDCELCSRPVRTDT